MSELTDDRAVQVFGGREIFPIDGLDLQWFVDGLLLSRPLNGLDRSRRRHFRFFLARYRRDFFLGDCRFSFQSKERQKLSVSCFCLFSGRWAFGSNKVVISAYLFPPLLQLLQPRLPLAVVLPISWPSSPAVASLLVARRRRDCVDNNWLRPRRASFAAPRNPS